MQLVTDLVAQHLRLGLNSVHGVSILVKMSDMHHYKYHPRCKQSKLTHLSFVDSLILCSKGDYAFVYLLLRAFQMFSDSSGLKTNAQNLHCIVMVWRRGESGEYSRCLVYKGKLFHLSTWGVPIY